MAVTKTIPLLLLLALGTFGLSPSALAWGDAGHRIVAALAFRELPPAAQKHLHEILQAHPEYAQWRAAWTREGGDVDLGLYLFMRAAAWPDEIRRPGGPYDHPHWHFIDYPLRAPKFPVTPPPSREEDILHGLAEAERALAARSTPPEARAAYLSWLIHLVGDLHQPLHCGELVSAEFPHGDKGGNDFWVKPGARAIKLHALWDGLLGTPGHARGEINAAVRLAAEYPTASLKSAARERSPNKWSLESRRLAIEKVYLSGKLRGGTNEESAIPLPAGYAKTGQAVAERQAAVAGARLAAAIKTWVR